MGYLDENFTMIADYGTTPNDKKCQSILNIYV